MFALPSTLSLSLFDSDSDSGDHHVKQRVKVNLNLMDESQLSSTQHQLQEQLLQTGRDAAKLVQTPSLPPLTTTTAGQVTRDLHRQQHQQPSSHHHPQMHQSQSEPNNMQANEVAKLFAESRAGSGRAVTSQVMSNSNSLHRELSDAGSLASVNSSIASDKENLHDTLSSTKSGGGTINTAGVPTVANGVVLRRKVITVFARFMCCEFMIRVENTSETEFD